jgi:hypothetical protein
VVVGTSTEEVVEEAGRVVLTRVVELVEETLEVVGAAVAVVVVAALVATAVVSADPD